MSDIGQQNQPNSKKKPPNPQNEAGAWIGIVIMLFAFWPVGLFLLLRKLRDYAKNTGNTNSQNTQRRYDPTSPLRTNPSTGEYSSSGKYTAPAAKTAYTYANRVENREPSNDSKTGSNIKHKKSEKEQKSAIPALLICLSVVLTLVGLGFMIPVINDVLTGGSNLIGLLYGAFCLLGGVTSFVARGVYTRKLSRFRKYAAVIGNKESMPVGDIVAATGISEKVVRRDLEAMISGGQFSPTAYVDNFLDSFVQSSEIAERERQKVTGAPPAGENTDKTADNNYKQIIDELRALNDNIGDVSISDKIEHIELTTGKIFMAVEENPAKLPQIKKFMNYYLPTTLKLLRSYATLEKQGINGENIKSTKEDIDRILGTLAAGFERQLDQLFKTDVIDISSDIDVLENMMERDGLSGGGQTFTLGG